MARLRLITVDEIIGNDVGLSIAPWPFADEWGRLRFLSPSSWRFEVVSRRELCEFISGCGYQISPNDPPLAGAADRPERYLRVGDTFAAELALDFISGGPPLENWILKPLHDLTVDAREMAKLAFYGAAVGTWTHEENERYGFVESEGAQSW